ncbi:hypothetical protein OIU78_020871 [Salix suchowensis]|nr:hypothetical protein OIU78_020871 [Salix suchowensis]
MADHVSDASPLIPPSPITEPSEIDLEAGPGEQFQCRICLETDGRDFIAPCKCKGTTKYVHRECLDQWRAVKDDRPRTGQDKMLHLHGGYSHYVNGSVNEHLYIGIIHIISIFLVLAKLSNCILRQKGFAFSHCTTCKAPYHLRVHAAADRKWRTLKFRFFVTRDIVFIFLAVQLVIASLAYLVYLIDTHQKSWLRLAWGFDSELSFYYICGALLFFALLGLSGCFITCYDRKSTQ